MKTREFNNSINRGKSNETRPVIGLRNNILSAIQRRFFNYIFPRCSHRPLISMHPVINAWPRAVARHCDNFLRKNRFRSIGGRAVPSLPPPPPQFRGNCPVSDIRGGKSGRRYNPRVNFPSISEKAGRGTEI